MINGKWSMSNDEIMHFYRCFDSFFFKMNEAFKLKMIYENYHLYL